MKKILIYNSGGGLGDSIQLFPLLISLKGHFKKAKFYYLGAHTNHFNGRLKEYNISLETVDLGLKYFGFRAFSNTSSTHGSVFGGWSVWEGHLRKNIAPFNNFCCVFVFCFFGHRACRFIKWGYL